MGRARQVLWQHTETARPTWFTTLLRAMVPDRETARADAASFGSAAAVPDVVCPAADRGMQQLAGACAGNERRRLKGVNRRLGPWS